MSTEKRILFIGLSYVGDVVMTTPIILSLHEKYPNAVFDVVADKRSCSLYSACPFIEKIFIKDKNRLFRGMPDLFLKLRKNKYDIIVDVRTDGLSFFLKGKKRYTKRNAKPYGDHAVEKLSGVIADLHGDNPVPKTSLWLNQSDITYAEKKLSFIKDQPGKILALSVGDPKKPHKNWPEEKYIELIKRHQQDFKCIVFLGGADEKETNNRLISITRTGSVNAAGNSLLETAALLQHCDIYIGPDSGIGHIAAAMNTITISFFSTVSPDYYRPWGNQSYCLVGKDRTARDITVDSVSQIIETLDINE